MLAIVLLVITSVSSSSLAADIFIRPSNKIIHTKYAKDCGGVREDLQKDMPPVDDQYFSDACAVLGVKALVE